MSMAQPLRAVLSHSVTRGVEWWWSADSARFCLAPSLRLLRCLMTTHRQTRIFTFIFSKAFPGPELLQFLLVVIGVTPLPQSTPESKISPVPFPLLADALVLVITRILYTLIHNDQSFHWSSSAVRNYYTLRELLNKCHNRLPGSPVK